MTRAEAETGVVTLIQRFGSALNLYIHFHMLFLDSVYTRVDGGLLFRRVAPPTAEEMQKLIHRVSHRVGRYLERAGLLVRDMENNYLTLQARDGSAMDDLIGHSITYRVAVGSHQGRKAFTLQAIPAQSYYDASPGAVKKRKMRKLLLILLLVGSTAAAVTVPRVYSYVILKVHAGIQFGAKY